MFRSYLILITILWFSVAFSQKEGNVWYFGNHAGLDFNSGVPIPLSGGQINSIEGCSSICDASGQLLFYTDGVTVWDRQHNTMPNGTGLLGHTSSTQSALIVPKPNSSNIYYIFTVAQLGQPNGVRYSELDMNLNGGYGDITVIKNIQLITPVAEKLAAVKNANGDGYWVITHAVGNNNFYSFRVTSTGIDATPIISSVGALTGNSGNDAIGYIKFSPDGKRILNCNFEVGVYLYDFDLNTGVISNEKKIYSGYSYGAEFSPSGRLAYTSHAEPTLFGNPFTGVTYLFQYNLDSYNILGTSIPLYYYNPVALYVGQLGALQLGPDGKIYITSVLRNSISVINNPDVLGTGCDFQVDTIPLGSGISQEGLPQLPQSVFAPYFTAENLCLGTPTQFNIPNLISGTTVVWNFGDGTTSTNLNPSHMYPAGTHNVTLTATLGTTTKTYTSQVIITEAPYIANNIGNQTVCNVSTISVDFNPFIHVILGNQSGSAFIVSFYSTYNDAVTNQNVLPYFNNLPIGTSTFYARIHAQNNINCFLVSDSFTVTLYRKPRAFYPSRYVLCDSPPLDNKEQFNLATKNAQVLNGQNPADYTITYHASQAEANNDANPLPLLYTNTLFLETLYIRVANAMYPSCFSTSTLTIELLQRPTQTLVSDYVKCGTNGVASFDLTTKTPEVLNGQSSSYFVVDYYLNLIDAQNGLNPVVGPFNNTISPQTVYYGINFSGYSGCSAVGSFKLIVNTLPLVTTPSDYFQCDDASNDGVGQFDLATKTASILGNQSLTDFTISYHLNQNDANTNGSPLPLNYQNISNPQRIYVRLENKQNTLCFATTSFVIGLYKMPIAHQPSDMVSCDDSSNNTFESFHLASQNVSVLGSQSPNEFNITYHSSQSEADTGANPLSTIFNNTANPQTIYVRMENKLSPICFDTTSFQLEVKPKPVLHMLDVYSICQGSSITVSAPTGFTSYLWSNGITAPTATITQSGNYSLTVTKDYGSVICDETKYIEVYSSNIATITSIATVDWTDVENSITVHVSGDGDYEYAIDGFPYQDSPYFSGLQYGTYQVFVRDKKGCGTVQEEVFLLSYPKFFTPNTDGYHDYWQIHFSEFEPNMKISIYDRYGKVIYNFTGRDLGWDGSYNGNTLPADDYWFVVNRANGKIYKGHFSLKR